MNIFLSVLMVAGFLLMLARGLGFGYPGTPAPPLRYYHFGWLGAACFGLVAVIKLWGI